MSCHPDVARTIYARADWFFRAGIVATLDEPAEEARAESVYGFQSLPNERVAVC